MEESTAAKQVEPVAVTIGPAEKTAAPETFRRQQHRQRQPLNLLQCMDKDGNIDAFRYIEYSRRRRLEFLKRADFICKMKSTLRMHHQHQQLLNRSTSMPGITTMSVIPPNTSFMANEAVKTVNHSGFVSPETTPTAGILYTDELKSLGAGGSSSSSSIKNTTVNKNNASKNRKLNTFFAMPSPVRLMARSVSMPFVASSFGTNAAIDGNGTNTGATAPRVGSRNEESRPTPRQRLRKEEFEAAEALLFGMGRGPAEISNRPRESAGKKRGNASSSSDEIAESAKAGVVDGVKGCIETGCHEASGNSSKKQKVSDPPKGEVVLSRSEEAESAPSVVSTEDDSSGNIANNVQVNEAVTAVHGFCSPGKPK